MYKVLLVVLVAFISQSVFADNKKADVLSRSVKCGVNYSYFKEAFPEVDESESATTVNKVIWVTIESSKNVMMKTFGALNMEVSDKEMSEKPFWVGLTFPINSVSSEESERYMLSGFDSKGNENILITVGKNTITINPEYSRTMGYVLNDGKPTPMTCIVWE